MIANPRATPNHPAAIDPHQSKKAPMMRSHWAPDIIGFFGVFGCAGRACE
jgi:hypothetical protein